MWSASNGTDNNRIFRPKSWVNGNKIVILFCRYFLKVQNKFDIIYLNLEIGDQKSCPLNCMEKENEQVQQSFNSWLLDEPLLHVNWRIVVMRNSSTKL